jgi:hypothetical protein
MSSSIRFHRSTQVALVYVVLGLGYVGMLMILLNTIWAGSLMRLWQDAWSFAPSIQLFLAAMLINFVAAVMIHRYERQGRTIRFLGVLVAVGIFVVSAIGAIQVFELWQKGLLTDVVPPETVWVRSIGALIYGWLAAEVVRLARASTNRHE